MSYQCEGAVTLALSILSALCLLLGLAWALSGLIGSFPKVPGVKRGRVVQCHRCGVHLYAAEATEVPANSNEHGLRTLCRSCRTWQLAVAHAMRKIR